jgi:hypothetical protein
MPRREWRNRQRRESGAVQALKPEARHRLPLHDAAMLERPFIYDSKSQTLIAPWSPTHSTFATQQALFAMVRVIVEDGSPPGVYWLYPDGRKPVPVQAEDVVTWCRHWQKDRACYRLDQPSR